jgi:hypothetical protein
LIVRDTADCCPHDSPVRVKDDPAGRLLGG